MTELPANLRPAVCKALPVKTNAETIARFKRRIELLETPENAAQLDAEQKEDVEKLTPDIDCPKRQ